MTQKPGEEPQEGKEKKKERERGGGSGIQGKGSLCVPCGNFLSACGTTYKATACHAASQAPALNANVLCSEQPAPGTHIHTHTGWLSHTISISPSMPDCLLCSQCVT